MEKQSVGGCWTNLNALHEVGDVAVLSERGRGRGENMSVGEALGRTGSSVRAANVLMKVKALCDRGLHEKARPAKSVYERVWKRERERERDGREASWGRALPALHTARLPDTRLGRATGPS